MKVFLTGFSGSGKSTVGPILARHLKCDYIDCDSEIEKTSGMSIPEIFADKGEVFFRQLEHQTVRRLSDERIASAVIGLGGGAFIIAKNRTLIRKAGVTAYLRCEINELYRRLQKHQDRPLLFKEDMLRKAVIAQIRKLMNKRRRFYELADIIISTTNVTPAQAAREIKRRLDKYGY
jgi:shikimate kinase